MQTYARESATVEALVTMVRSELDNAGLDCECRGRLEMLLDHLAGRHRLRKAGESIARARILRDNIARLIALLADLDDLGTDEPDISVFHELADLFDDVQREAEAGAAALRQAAGNLTAPEGYLS